MRRLRSGALRAIRRSRGRAEPPPETRRIRFNHAPAACLAPQYLAEELLKAEGFTDIQYVTPRDHSSATLNRMIVAGEIHFTMNDAPSWLVDLDGEAPLVLLAGVHTGCYELFVGERIRTIRDLRGKKVAVPGLGNGRHLLRHLCGSCTLLRARDRRPPGRSVADLVSPEHWVGPRLGVEPVAPAASGEPGRPSASPDDGPARWVEPSWPSPDTAAARAGIGRSRNIRNMTSVPGA